MATEVKAPVFPESVSEGTLMAWYKQPGDSVQPDEKLADIETDKIVLEVAAISAGQLESVLKNEGDVVLSGEAIATLAEGEVAATKPADKPTAEAEPQPADDVPAATAEDEDDEEEEPSGQMGPAARKLIVEHKLDATAIKGSGRGGRINKADVMAYLENQAAAPAPAAQPETVPVPPAAPTPRPESDAADPVPNTIATPTKDPGGRTEERVPMSRIRARIAERLVEAQRTAAILTTFNEVNMKPVMDLRQRHKATFEKQHGVKLGFMSFFVKAAVEALKRFPAVNASIDGTDVIYHGYYDIGIAVSSPRGLVVPIIRNADLMSYATVESTIRDFGGRAQENKLALDELQGGTFSISNGGIFGSMLSTPILNPPQSAILGMHSITDRAVVEDGAVVVRPVMYLALSYDHRIVDGREAVLFLVTIKEMLEDPSRLLLEV